MNMDLNYALAQERIDDLHRAGERERRATATQAAERGDHPLTIRMSRPADSGPVTRVARLDSQWPPGEPLLVAGVAGTVRDHAHAGPGRRPVEDALPGAKVSTAAPRQLELRSHRVLRPDEAGRGLVVALRLLIHGKHRKALAQLGRRELLVFDLKATR